MIIADVVERGSDVVIAITSGVVYFGEAGMGTVGTAFVFA